MENETVKKINDVLITLYLKRLKHSNGRIPQKNKKYVGRNMKKVVVSEYIGNISLLLSGYEIYITRNKRIEGMSRIINL